MQFETPEADAAEQQQDDVAAEEPVDESPNTDSPGDVDPADLAEQRAVVPDDDDYEHD